MFTFVLLAGFSCPLSKDNQRAWSSLVNSFLNLSVNHLALKFTPYLLLIRHSELNL